MEEASKIHNMNIEWGCVVNLLDKISDLEEKIEGGWPELIDMVADAVTEESTTKDPVSTFFNLYQFLWRVYYRVKRDKRKRPFNEYLKVENEYWIKNYTYNILKWANKNGFNTGIDNLIIKIPMDKLTDKQKTAFDRRCK